VKNPPSGKPAGFPSFQGAGSASGNGDQSGAPPFLSSLANLSWSPPPTALGGGNSVALESNASPSSIDSTGADIQNDADRLEGAQAQVQGAPFAGLANPDAAESLRSQAAYNACLKANGRGGSFEVGRFRFCTAGPRAVPQFDDGFSVIVSAPTYGYDPDTRAYATFEASPPNVLELREYDDGRVTIAPFGSPR
jgi:hypothetical protein